MLTKNLNLFYSLSIWAAMGYNEGQYSLPRWMDLSVSRQGFFDDTFQKTPTEGWMFLPLDVYHGGGDAAKFEPLSKNIKVLNWARLQLILIKKLYGSTSSKR